VWEFDARNERLSRATIHFIGVEQVPQEYDIMLVNRHNSRPTNIRLHPDYEYETVSERMSFKLLIGKSDFVASELQKEIPTEFRLAQNYPNPFNPSTSIEFSVPRETAVKLEIVSVLGERVAVLGDERYQAGTYTLVWNSSSSVATGIYFCRLVVDGKPIALNKMLLLK
jgi:hypothetical protein